jgi:hypothetical protein
MKLRSRSTEDSHHSPEQIQNQGNKSPNANKLPTTSSNKTNPEINTSKSPNSQSPDFSDFLDVSQHTCASSQTTIDSATEGKNLSDPDITQDLESELRNDEEPVNFYDSDLSKHKRFLSFEGISPVPKINRPVKSRNVVATLKLTPDYKKSSNKTNNQEKQDSKNSEHFETTKISANNPKTTELSRGEPIKINKFYGDKQQNSELNKKIIQKEQSWYEPVPMADIYTPNESITRIDSEQLKNIGSQKSLFQSTPCVKNIFKNKFAKSTPEVQITKEIFNMSIETESDESGENEVIRQNARNSHKNEFDDYLLDCLKLSGKVSKQKMEVNLRSTVFENLGPLPNFQEQFKETLLRLVDQGVVQRMSGKGMTGSFKLAEID